MGWWTPDLTLYFISGLKQRMGSTAPPWEKSNFCKRCNLTKLLEFCKVLLSISNLEGETWKHNRAGWCLRPRFKCLHCDGLHGHWSWGDYIKSTIDENQFFFSRWLSKTRAWFWPQQISNRTHFKLSLVWNTYTSIGFSIGAKTHVTRFGQIFQGIWNQTIFWSTARGVWNLVTLVLPSKQC